MHIMSRSMGGGHPHAQYPGKYYDSGPQYQPVKALYGSNGARSSGFPHEQSAPRFVPRSNAPLNGGGYTQYPATVAYGSGTYLNYASGTGSSVHGLHRVISHSPSGGNNVLVHSQSLPSGHSHRSYGQSYSQQAPRPRQGRYSVTNLDFKDFQAANDVASFLRFLRLHKYIETVERQGITLMQLLSCTEEELTNIGFHTIGARTRLVKGIERFHEYNAQRWHMNGGDRPSSLPKQACAPSRSSGMSVGSLGSAPGPLMFTSSDDGPSSSWSGGIDVDSYFHARRSSADLDGNVLADDMLRFLWIDDNGGPTGARLAPADDSDEGALLSKIISKRAISEDADRRAARLEDLSSGTSDSEGDCLSGSPTYDLWGTGDPKLSR